MSKPFEHNNFKITTIGEIYDGYSSTDGYFLFQTLDYQPIVDDEIDEAFAQLWFREGRGAGTSFCTSYRIMRDGVLDDRAVVIVQFGMDI
jgi:hypothetical protein